MSATVSTTCVSTAPVVSQKSIEEIKRERKLDAQRRYRESHRELIRERNKQYKKTWLESLTPEELAAYKHKETQRRKDYDRRRKQALEQELEQAKQRSQELEEILKTLKTD